jgi:hypothetical protein
VTAAQAFHWFKGEAARREFARILRRGGWAVLVWNRRLDEGTPFLRAYEALLQTLGPAYTEVDHRRAGDPRALSRFFGPGGWVTGRFSNRQALDWPGLEGRALSSSYVPLAGRQGHETFMAGLRRLFETYSDRGSVVLEYRTELFAGRLG